MNRRITSNDVAKKAKVSQATVSRILAGKTNFSPDTMMRVKQAAEALGYKPNVIASSLASNRTNLIAVVSVKSDNPFVYETFTQICQYLRKHNKRVLYIEVEKEHQKQIDELLNDIVGYQVDGVIILYAAISKENRDFACGLNVPIVEFNRQVIYDHVFSVSSDNSEAGRMVAGYLINKGYTSFGALTGPGIVVPQGSSRSRSFVERLRELGFDEVAIEHCEDYSFENGAKAARRIFSLGKRPQAIFCDSDMLAFGAIHVIRGELGLDIPGDVAIVGFDNVAASAWGTFNLTTLEHDNLGMIAAALQYIEDCNNSIKRTDKIRLFPCRLIERGSV